jgi:hypothetical protein
LVVTDAARSNRGAIVIFELVTKKEVPMTQFKTAFLATAFALATTMAFAQGAPPVSGSEGPGATIGATPSSGGVSTNDNMRVRGNTANINTSNNTVIRKNKAETTGSGSVGNQTGHGSPD